MRRSHRFRNRSGFTLIEVLVVIIVISILLALLVPAVGAARRRVNVARVTAEIKSLESAITKFRGDYGIEPPSRITIHITKAGWDGDPASKSLIRRMWPQFDFSMPSGSFPASWTSDQQMNSGECLLFFLGGIVQNGACTGFAKNPAQPFNPTITNRTSALHEFDPGRIRDTDSTPNGIPEYLDSLPEQAKPLLYFSSYEGKSYRVTGATSELPAGGTLLDVYRVGQTAVSPPGPGTQTLPAQKPSSFQIISPGYDQSYGQGGVWNPQLPNSGLAHKDDQDNITNFSPGTLLQ